MTATTGPTQDGAGALAVAALMTDTAEHLVLGAVRDVHDMVSRRVRRATGVPSDAPRPVATAVYAGVSVGLRATARALRHADRRGLGARLDGSRAGRSTVGMLNGWVGDRLAAEQSPLTVRMAVRADHRDVVLTRDRVAHAFPAASPDVVVFLHGLGETDRHWFRDAHLRGGSYGSRLAERHGWTPVYLRANTGLPVAENGAALAGLLDDLMAVWPTDVRRIALVGHSMGGLVLRAACAVRTLAEHSWADRVTDVVTLGTPHLGAPLERGVHVGASAMGRFPQSAPFGRILEHRSAGILDLRSGLAADLQHLRHARYRLVGATLAGSPRHPVSMLLGDAMVRLPSATGRPWRGRALFPDADVLHVRGGHLSLLNHPEVADALVVWLGPEQTG